MQKIPTYDISKISAADFTQIAMNVFHYQQSYCRVYQDYCKQLGIMAKEVNKLTEIPFLPIEFFKTHHVADSEASPALMFESSGTTGQIPSKHFVQDAGLYEQSFMHCFNHFYGSPEKYVILALLPSYLERQHSSLVYMTERLLKKSGHARNGFFLHDFNQLHQVLTQNEHDGIATILLGVSYALLDFAEKFPISLKHTIVMETGGMKGKRAEIQRAALHRILRDKFQLDKIHSEYGMTELLSQAYSKGDGIFYTPPQMKVLIREEDDPLLCRQSDNIKESINGPVNIIDLSNLHSCSFIATEDWGKLYPNGSFEIIGRVPDSSIRGCGLMYEG